MNISIRNNQKLQSSNHKQKKSPNKITTTLYNIYTFIPLGLFNQFKLVSNIYFLLIAIFAIIPEVSPIDPYSAFLPVIYVILFSLCFDWYYDLKRYLSDTRTNNQIVNVIRNNKAFEIKAKNLEVGDYLVINDNERTLADIVLLSFKSTKDYCFIDTSSLDGEKTLKPKYSILEKNLDQDCFLLDGPQEDQKILREIQVQYSQNEEELNNFDARIQITYQNSQQEYDIKQNLDINNFIPRTAMIRNTDTAIGLVVYVGFNTKVMKNMQKRLFKKSSLEKSMHAYILYILLFMLIMMFFLAFFSLLTDQHFDFDKNILKKNFAAPIQFLMTVLSYITLMNTIIPISLIITFQITKLVQNFLYLSQSIYIDKENNKKTLINSTDLNEELGQVEYILSDKTGTLTQNKMVAKNFLIQYQNQILVRKLNQEQLNQFQPITLQSQDQSQIFEIKSQEQLNFLYYLLINTNHDCFAKGVITEDNNEQDIYQQMQKHTEFEGPSPDEIAILKGSKDYCGFLMKGADSRLCTLTDKENQNYVIEKLFIFKFDSNRKMMSMIIKYDDKYFLMCKGADVSIEENALYKPEGPFWHQVDKYLEEGLRVMFMGIKLISEQELKQFQQQLEQLQNSDESAQKIYEFKQTIEKDLYLIGASAIEDKLQENLQETIEALKLARIKIWVITGDKSDTARNIAYSAGLYNKDFKTIQMDEDLLEDILHNAEDSMDVKKKKNKVVWRWSRQIEGALKKEKIPTDTPLTPRLSLKFIKNKNLFVSSKQNLLIPGKILALALKSPKKNLFTNYLKQYQCVVFSRTNPKQKVEIVRLLKNQNIKTLAIGDGANDVNMIQEANVGIGVIGEEGKQAINASDYAIPQFQFLQHLVLNFGRRCYYNNSAYVLQFFYKNIFVTMTQFYYAFQSDFSSSNIYHDWYIAVYNMFFTAFMHPGTAIQNIDLDDRSSYYQPKYVLEAYVYYYGQLNKYFNFKKFCMWIGAGMFDSLFCYLVLYFVFNDDIYYNNHGPNYTAFSYTLMFVVVISVNFKIIYSTFSYGFFNIIGILFSLSLFFIYTFATDFIRTYGYYKGVSYTYQVRKFWYVSTFLVFSLLLINNTYFTAMRYFFKSIKDKIRSIKQSLDNRVLLQLLEGWRNKDILLSRNQQKIYDKEIQLIKKNYKFQKMENYQLAIPQFLQNERCFLLSREDSWKKKKRKQKCISCEVERLLNKLINLGK